jgi:DnaJ-class molecular chaperone
MLDGKEQPADFAKCARCKGAGNITTTLLPSKKMAGKTIKAMCPDCLGKGEC